ncbi:MAG: fibronectin type III domain-containing protein [Bdellovibrionales bacterium]|nr:fibronectin type III domain-containing protein [Bdellovibrionales bacterium]
MKLRSKLLILTLFTLSTVMCMDLVFAQNKRIISLEWEPVEEATAYEIQFTSVPENPDEKSKTFKKVVESSEWNGLLPLGKYDFRVRSYDKRGVPGQWSNSEVINVKISTVKAISPKDKTKIYSKNDDNQEIEFVWVQGKQDDTYKLIIESKDKEIKKELKTSETSLKAELPVGRHYIWRVEIDQETVLKEPAGSGNHLIIVGKKLDTPKINPPGDKPEALTWQPVEHADAYSYYIATERPDKKWKIVTKKKKVPDLSISVPETFPDGKYKIAVKAHGKLRMNSDKSTLEFNLQRKRDLAAVQTKEKLVFEPTWYGHANYYITNLKYRNEEAQGQGSVFDVLGGTGELGVSYTKTNQPYGFYMLGSLGGFITSGKLNNYYSVESYLTYTNWSENKKSFQHSIGLYHKKYPHIWADNTGANVTYEDVTQLGLVYGIDYWRHFIGKLGLSASAKIYLGTEVGTTPTGGSPNDGNSFKTSVLGSYQLSDSSIGYMGVTYFNEEVKWPSSQAAPNKISMQGTYLSFELDYKF